MGAAIGGHHTVMQVTITRTRRHTVALTMATVITTARRITTTTRELMAGMGVLLARTDRRPGGLATILTRERTHEAVPSRLLMAPEVPRKRTTHTPAPMRRRDKVRARTLNGVVHMSHAGIKALPWDIIRRPTEQWLVPRRRREEKRLPPVRSGETALSVKLPAAICTLDTMVTFIRIQVTAGRNTIMGAGTL